MKTTLAAGLLLAAGAAFAEGPIMTSLQNAAAAPMGANLEIQAANAAAPFSGNRGDGAVNAAAGKSTAPKLSGASLSKPGGKDNPPAPPLSEKESKNLKLIRGAGLTAAVAGLGLFAFAVITAATGPIGWAAALVFFGGLSAYLAHRRLNGKNDFQ